MASDHADAPATPVVIMGVSGSGKSTVGRQVADRLGARFVEGDDLHPAANLAKMAASVPLTDDDRDPWLDAVAAVLVSSRAGHEAVVVSCSALRRRYRDRLRATGPVRFVLLDVSGDDLERRVRTREHPFMPPTLLASQLDALERPDADEVDVVVIAVGDRTVGAVVDEVVADVDRGGAPG
ncbi:MAG TPA: gluconokinase, GntK/IdnK-type [Acidimicrobiales bacterium]|nr:gluconokinase, GntK/IdnK-type [Acidimicrobiales bacterium]